MNIIVSLLLSLMVLMLSSSAVAAAAASSASKLFNLTILHTNDIHCRFEEANKFGGLCSSDDASKGKCFGGYARLVTAIRQLRQSNPNTIYVHGGDFFQGTMWYTLNKWRVVNHFTNMLNLTAMSLGNHEFDDGISGLLPFLEKANHPVLAANFDMTGEPGVAAKVKKSTVVEVGGRKVGIIGYLTQETAYLSSPGKIQILDEVESVAKEALSLKRQGVDILIAVGHAGYQKDMEIASKVPDIDVVVGGHSHSFLWSGATTPSVEEPVGPYPTIVTQQASGKKVPVVQAYAFGKYLGNLMVTLNDRGELVAWSGSPIIMDKTIAQDPQVLNELTPWKQQVDAVSQKEVGTTLVFLQGDRLVCRMKECNLGNLIADGYVDVFTQYATAAAAAAGQADQWNQVSIALLNGGAIRSSIDERALIKGTITYGNVGAVSPFPNTVDVVKITGHTLKKMFEYSVDNYNKSSLEPFGGFLQVSGIQVVYNVSRPRGDRVVELFARCSKCRIPTFDPVEAERVYDVAMTSYLATGGDGYAFLQKEIIDRIVAGFLDADTTLAYMKKMSPITIGVERRIRFI